MNGNMGRNPVFRWMALFADTLVGKDFDGGLSNLKAVVEKPLAWLSAPVLACACLCLPVRNDCVLTAG